VPLSKLGGSGGVKQLQQHVVSKMKRTHEAHQY
jgi:hypothetical protein